ncbi:MAG: VOC family protein [Pseudomonadota bacterium]
MSQPVGAVMQFAYVVNDIEAAINSWLRSLKAGPFFLLREIEILDPIYRQQSIDPSIDIALGYSGNVCIELIMPRDDTPSVYRELLNRKPEGGFHHWGVFSERFEADIADYNERGYESAFSGRVAVGDAFCYVDTSKHLGGMVELIKLTPAVKTLFAEMELAAVNWDGAEPIR